MAAIGFYTINLAVRVIRWRTLLQDVKALSFSSVGTALLVGYAMNNILPARLGELFRANFAGLRYQAPRSAIAGSIIVERTLDGLIVVASLVLGRLFVSEQAVLSSLTGASLILFSTIFIILWILSTGVGWDLMAHFPPAIAKRLQRFRSGLRLYFYLKLAKPQKTHRI